MRLTDDNLSELSRRYSIIKQKILQDVDDAQIAESDGLSSRRSTATKKQPFEYMGKHQRNASAALVGGNVDLKADEKSTSVMKPAKHTTSQPINLLVSTSN